MELRQCYNALTVVGTLKSKEVKYGTTANGDQTISIELLVVSNDEERINESRVKLWAKNTSKLYNSYVTIANEYKTIDDNGADEADRIKVLGSLEMNEYYSTNLSALVTRNALKGVFVNRLDKDLKDETGAVVECIIAGITDEMTKEGKITGRKKVKLLTVGYQSSIHEIQNVYIGKELAAQFCQMYQVNSTGKLYLKVNNYVEKVEEKPEEKPVVGFGNPLSNMPDTAVKNYTNEIIIVGGDMPNVANRFTMEQIGEINRLRDVSRNEKLSPAASTPPSGFGAGFGDSPTNGGQFFPGTIDDGDIPF